MTSALLKIPDAQSLAGSILSWSVAHALLMLATSLTVIFTGQSLLIVASITLSLGYYLWKCRAYLVNHYLHIGRANLVTLSRIAIACLLFALHQDLPNIICAIVFFLLICLDGVDGYVARRYKESSQVGQYLDMEVDAAIVLLLTMMLWQSHGFPWLLLFPGTLRYTYVILIQMTTKNQILEPRRQYASVIAVCFNLSLVLNLGVSMAATAIILSIASLLLAFSFTRSWIYQIRNH